MLIEIPDINTLLGWVLAFVIGLMAPLLFFKLKTRFSLATRLDVTAAERLDYYEKQLIDLKIRLDGFVGGDLSSMAETAEAAESMKVGGGGLATRVSSAPDRMELPRVTAKVVPTHKNVVEWILHLITEDAMTSRDIQAVIGRTREHTARLMKRLSEEGYIKRNTVVKPYTYQITERGRVRLGGVESKF